MTTSRDIRANSVLPARRTPLELHTADGLSLVGELAVPLARDPLATLICVHPLPTHGGMMDSHVFRKAAYRLPALADLAVLRFNTRGTSSVQGTSEGAFDRGVGERFDVAAALEYAEFEELPRIWMIGWSFGTDLVLKYGCEPHVEGAVLLSPSLRWSTPEDLAAWEVSGKPVTALVPEFDDNLRPPEARERFGAAIPQAEVVGIDGGKHLWVGKAERALNEIVARVWPSPDSAGWAGAAPRPAPVPLPETWDGPMEYADASAYADRTVAAFADVPVDAPNDGPSDASDTAPPGE